MCWAITRDNIYVIACSPNDPIIIWNIKEKTQEATLGDDSIFIMALAITSDNKYIISCEYHPINNEIVYIEGHKGMILGLAITSDDKYPVQAENTILWDYVIYKRGVKN